MALASLPMYDLPFLSEATNEWWRGLSSAFEREGIAGVPQDLSRGPTVRDLWTDQELVFSQTCGYPLIHALRHHVALVATPCYAAPGCAGTDYCSVIVVPADSNARSLEDLKGAACVINRRDSHSGCNVLRYMAAPYAAGGKFFGRVIVSGDHRESLKRVASCEADVAAIDCVTHALIDRHEPHITSRTRVLCYSPPAPGLPYVTSSSASDDLPAKLRKGLETAFSDASLANCRQTLMLTGFRLVPLSEYSRMAAMRDAATARGYGELE